MAESHPGLPPMDNYPYRRVGEALSSDPLATYRTPEGRAEIDQGMAHPQVELKPYKPRMAG